MRGKSTTIQEWFPEPSCKSTTIQEYLQFAKDFSTKCLDKEQADALTGYLEAEDISGGTNYNNISISSGLSNISWGSLSPKLYMEGVPLIDDINETTASITLDYQVSAQDDEGKTEIYDVTELSRMPSSA